MDLSAASSVVRRPKWREGPSDLAFAFVLARELRAFAFALVCSLLARTSSNSVKAGAWLLLLLLLAAAIRQESEDAHAPVRAVIERLLISWEQMAGVSPPP